MRVAIIVVAVSLASLPALASPSCMTQSEARQKFPNSHLWWHGPNRCWDATASRARLAQRIRARETRQAVREAEPEREAVEEKKPSRSAASDSKWREAMSKARPEDLVASTSVAAASAQAEVTLVAPATTDPPHADWRERWVEIVQRVPPIVGEAGPADLAADARAAEPLVTPTRVMLALLVLLLAFGTFELVVRRPGRDRAAD
jgi:hypothetical protein